MKIRSMFHICVTLMTILMLSLPLLSLAEQIPVADITIIATGDAELDASRDTNKTVWFLSGMVPVCLVAAITVASDQTGGEYEEAILHIAPNCFSPIVGMAVAFVYSPSPPTERFIGKSPEYISAYTDAYKSKARWVQAQWAAGGAATGCGVSVLGALLVVISGDGLLGTFVF